jgi:hypothetical protein
LTEKEDEDAALLMLETCEIVQLSDTLSEQVLLNEEKVVPKYTSARDASSYLDTGASNHMTGDPEKFAELDHSVNGRVRFGDGSSVEICGRGAILMQCLNGEHVCCLMSISFQNSRTISLVLVSWRRTGANIQGRMAS